MAEKKIHKSRIIIRWLMGCIFVSIIALVAFLSIKSPDYLQQYLGSFVSETSGGTYQLKLSSVEIKPFHRQLVFHNLEISPVELKQNANDTLDAKIYAFSSSQISLKGIHLFQLFIKKNIEMDELEISNPQLRFPGKQTEDMLSAEEMQQSMQQMQSLFQGVVRSVKIHSINISGAQYSFYSDKLSKIAANTASISLGVSQFFTDSILLSDPERLFDAEDIYLRIDRFEKQLSDSLHLIKAEQINYSLRKESLIAQKVELSPFSDDSTFRNRYRIHVPLLKIKSQSIPEIFTTDSIHIDSLLLDQADICYFPAKQTDTTDLSIQQLISKDLKRISIHQFVLNDAKVKLYSPENDSLIQQSTPHLHLKLYEFCLDSMSVSDDNRIFYSKQLEISAQNYQLTLGDRNHQFAAQYISGSSSDSLIRIIDARLQPSDENRLKQSQKIGVHVLCDSLLFKQADLKKAFHTRELPIRQVDIFKPEASLNLYDNNQQKEKYSTQFAYQLLSEYLRSVYASVITVENGRIEINNRPNGVQTGSIRSDFRFNLTDFALDSISARKTDKLFFATNLEMDLSNYQMQLVDQIHLLDIAQIHVSSLQKTLSVKDLYLRPISHNKPEELLKKNGHSELYEVRVPELWFLNTDIHQAFFKKKLTIDKLRVNRPTIDFERFAQLKEQENTDPGVEEFYELLSNYISDVEIRNAQAIDGYLKLINHSRKGKTIGFDNTFQLEIEHFRLNREEIGKRKLLFSDHIDLRISKHLFRLSDRVHMLQAGEIGLSTFNSKVFIRNAILYPDITNPESKKLPWNIYVEIPLIELSGVDLTKVYFEGDLSGGKLQLQKPAIKLYRNEVSTAQPDIKAFSLLLPEKLNRLAISDFQLTDGQLQLLKENGKQFVPYLGMQLSSNAKDIEIKSSGKSETDQVTSGELTALLTNLWIEPISKNQRVSIGAINYSTRSEDIRLSQLQISPRRLDSSVNQYELKVPEVKLSSFKLDKAYRLDQYQFGQISLEKPVFTFYRNTSDSTRFNPYKQHLFRYFKDFAEDFSSQRVSLNDANFRILKKGEERQVNNVNLHLNNFRVDRGAQQGFLHAGQFDFSIDKIVRQDKNKRYELSIDKLQFSSQNNQLTFSGIRLIPLQNKEQFAALVGHQTDYYRGDLQSAQMEHIDLPRWFDKKELIGSNIRCNKLNLDVYRDKRLPFNEKQRPPMPQDLLREIGTKFLFDSLSITNASVSYAEQAVNSPNAGIIRFSNANVQIYPFANMFEQELPAMIRLKVNTKLMDEPELSALVQFDMHSANNDFTVEGNISPCQLAVFNPMTVPAAQVEVNSGQLNKFEFEFNGNQQQAKGKLKFAYDDLNISILEIKDGESRKSKFSSFMANNLMLRSKNPRGKILLPDEIELRRDPKRSILNYWWKSIFSGVKNTFGLKDKKTTDDKTNQEEEN